MVFKCLQIGLHASFQLIGICLITHCIQGNHTQQLITLRIFVIMCQLFAVLNLTINCLLESLYFDLKYALKAYQRKVLKKGNQLFYWV